MVDYFITGNSYTTGDIVTAAKLNDMVNKATPQNFNRDHFATNSKIITTGSTAPSTPAFGEIWGDSTNTLLNSWDGNDWTSFWPRQELIFTAQSTISAGDVVVFDSGNASSVLTTSTANSVGVVGVATSAATTGGNVKVCVQGVVPVNVTGSTSIGDWLETSTTAGAADPVSSRAVHSFARALTTDTSSQVTAILNPQALQSLSSPQSNGFGTSGSGTLSFSRGSGTMVQDTWYEFPGALTENVSDPVTEFRHNFTTTRNNQLVFVVICEFTARISGGSYSSPEDFEFRIDVNGSFPVTPIKHQLPTGTGSTRSGDEAGSAYIFPDNSTNSSPSTDGNATLVRFENVVVPWIVSTAGTTFTKLWWRNVTNDWANTLSGSGRIRVFTDSPV